MASKRKKSTEMEISSQIYLPKELLSGGNDDWETKIKPHWYEPLLLQRKELTLFTVNN
jgi:hypothetical protein